MDMNSAVILEDSYAKKLGMKSPCIYVKPGYLERLILPLYDKTVVMQTFAHTFRFGDKPSRGFVEQDFPGSRITKHPRKAK
jgi:hypothetical protein